MYFYPDDVCVSEIEFDVKDNKIHNVHFTGGCRGNLQAVSALAEGRDVASTIELLKNISCGVSDRACPARFAEALSYYQKGELDKLRPLTEQEFLNRQQKKWNSVFAECPDMFGEEISYPATEALQFLKDKQAEQILELGCGQGRDTFCFAEAGYQVTALDYSEEGLKAVAQKAADQGQQNLVKTCQHDVRCEFPFIDNTFDVCYSHMLLNMALTEDEVTDIIKEVYRTLKPGGYHIFTVRNDLDEHYGQGIPRGKDLYEMDGFIVHYFSKETIENIRGQFTICDIIYFEEGELPRKLYYVIMQK